MTGEGREERAERTRGTREVAHKDVTERTECAWQKGALGRVYINVICVFCFSPRILFGFFDTFFFFMIFFGFYFFYFLLVSFGVASAFFFWVVRLARHDDDKVHIKKYLPLPFVILCRVKRIYLFAERALHSQLGRQAGSRNSNNNNNSNKTSKNNNSSIELSKNIVE